jgi:hypothetical protein
VGLFKTKTMLELLHPGYPKQEIMFNQTCIGWAILDVSGFWYFEPMQNSGWFEARTLREIADLIEGLNAPLEKNWKSILQVFQKRLTRRSVLEIRRFEIN